MKKVVKMKGEGVVSLSEQGTVLFTIDTKHAKGVVKIEMAPLGLVVSFKGYEAPDGTDAVVLLNLDRDNTDPEIRIWNGDLTDENSLGDDPTQVISLRPARKVDNA